MKKTKKKKQNTAKTKTIINRKQTNKNKNYLNCQTLTTKRTYQKRSTIIKQFQTTSKHIKITKQHHKYEQISNIKNYKTYSKLTKHINKNISTEYQQLSKTKK